MSAQEILPFTESFSKADYQGENQVWSICQGRDHALYFANNRYFLRYDGVAWERSALPARTAIRSLYAQGDRIYCGSYKEFGYWERRNGRLVYASLSSGRDFFSGASANEEIWKIFSYQGKVWFQSFNELYVYDGSRIRKFHLPYQISYCYPIGELLYVASIRDGVFLFDQGNLKPVAGWEALKNKIVHSIQEISGKRYVFTRDDGVFIDDGSGLKPWSDPLNPKLYKEVILSATYLGDHTLAIGTSLNGCYLVNLARGSTRHLDRSNVLRNNTVLQMFRDQESNLWLGLDNGIAHVEERSGIGLFTDTSGRLGTVYAINADGDDLLLGSNHGVFRWRDRSLEQIPGSQGQVWTIEKKGLEYLIGHNEGTFGWTKAGLHKRNTVTGGWKFLTEPDGKKLYQANYTGIATYPDISRLELPQFLPKLTKPIRDILFDRDGTLWAADNYRGLYRIPKGSGSSVRNVTEDQGFADDYAVKLLQLSGRIHFLINREWYVYDAGKLVADAFLNTAIGKVQEVFALNERTFFVLRDGVLLRLEDDGTNLKSSIVPSKYFSGRFVSGYPKVFGDKGRQFLNLDDGFLVIGGQTPVSDGKLWLEAFAEGRSFEASDKLRYGTTLTVRVLSDRYGFSRPEAFYRIDGGRWVKVSGYAISLSNLEGGSHELEVGRTDGKNFLPVSRLEFRTAYPWYFSTFMITAYIVVIVLSFFLYYRWVRLRTTQKMRLREEAYRHQNEIAQLALKAEGEERQRQFEKHILELEVRSKTNEVTGKSLSIAKQSEMIDTILGIVEQEEDPGRLKSRIRKAVRGNELNKHEWEAFESNLNQMNEGFTNRLLERYPNLSSKEIRLCVYLRMNLSSKEIAPLMNISYRGVELQRYRLRKKLGVAPDANLNQMMIGL